MTYLPNVHYNNYHDHDANEYNDADENYDANKYVVAYEYDDADADVVYDDDELRF